MPLVPLAEIHAGRVFRVSSGRGVFILKDLGAAQSRDRLELEHEILAHLDRQGVPVALPVRTAEGHTSVDHGGHLFTLSPSLDRPSEQIEDRQARLQNCGQAVAELHLALALLPVDEFAGRTWHNRPVAQVFDGLLPSLGRLLPEEKAETLLEALDDLEPGMRDSLADLPVQLIHRDCHPANVLTDGREVLGFVDCDHFSIGSPVLDIAYFLIHLVKWNFGPRETVVWLEEITLFLQGYERKKRLNPREREALPYMMVYVLVMFAEFIAKGSDWAALDVELAAITRVHSEFQAIRDRSSGER